MTIKQYKAGEIIIAEGTYGTQTFLIRQGRVMICKETGGKSRIPITILAPGEVFGEMYLFDDTGFRTASVVAQNDVEVEIIPKEEMEQLLEKTPQIVVSMIKTLSARLAQTSQENSILKFRQHGFIRRLFSKIF
jgi:CRP-like cAMP-binding protein